MITNFLAAILPDFHVNVSAVAIKLVKKFVNIILT